MHVITNEALLNQVGGGDFASDESQKDIAIDQLPNDTEFNGNSDMMVAAINPSRVAVVVDIIIDVVTKVDLANTVVTAAENAYTYVSDKINHTYSGGSDGYTLPDGESLPS